MSIRKSLSNIRAALRASIRTGDADVHVAPVTLVVVRERPRMEHEPYPAEELLRMATRMQERGHYLRAVRYYERAIDAFPLVMDRKQRAAKYAAGFAIKRCHALHVLRNWQRQHGGRSHGQA